MSGLPDAIQSWQLAGTLYDVDDTQIYAQKQGRGPLLVCFHGFPTSSWDWHLLAPRLRQDFTLLMFDFPGYGLSAKDPGRNYSLLRQMDAVEALLAQFGIRRFHLLAHDMGNSVACELLYRLRHGDTALQPQRLTLLNGGVYMDLHRPLFTQRLLRTPLLGEVTARLASRRVFNLQYPKVYADPDRFHEAHYDTQWALMQHREGRKVLAKIAAYMRERLKYTERWLGSLHRCELPVQLIWGQQDPIAVAAIGERLAENLPQATLHRLVGIGHYPQLEAPGQVSDLVRNFCSIDY